MYVLTWTQQGVERPHSVSLNAATPEAATTAAHQHLQERYGDRMKEEVLKLELKAPDQTHIPLSLP
ncbi:MAG TPA: hypothetical protein VLA04_00720 [Verrucomicrobiae bacterium]|nr:hypothetical protein [Verrucomicrobiae bacterium]